MWLQIHQTGSFKHLTLVCQSDHGNEVLAGATLLKETQVNTGWQHFVSQDQASPPPHWVQGDMMENGFARIMPLYNGVSFVLE